MPSVPATDTSALAALASPTGPVALLLPGQGAQQPDMATELYGPEPVFTAVMDEFFTLLGREGAELREDWLSACPRVPLDDACRAQPLLFAVGYALGRTLLAHGVRPAVLLGHSVGELAAAALAGVFDLADAAWLMSARSAAMAGVGPGGMLAVAARPEELAHLLPGGPGGIPGAVAVGAVNAPAQTVLSGLEPHLTEVEETLRAARLAARRVPARQAFHCPAVAGAADVFQAAFSGVSLNSPQIRVWSTRTGRPVRPHEAADAGFWAQQLAEPVLFWPALDNLLRYGDFTLVETGPGQGLSMLARRHPQVRSRRSRVVPLLPPRPGGDLAFLRTALTRLST
ncbi:acyltransferase domain-containing protein [Streptomyces sp. NRRL B-24085]|uniref:acyltransferase domain-containing protein n=1 Tax=Streptomyces sp. NRRL B-24085 TaxID=1709476 RepID=UPI0006B38094|nr:acyltransferase domain-containing protein [Streptomyces sp. NRRL B-24085]